MTNQEYRQTEVAWDTGETRGLWRSTGVPCRPLAAGEASDV